LECDHIVPRSLYQQLGYKFDTLDNKIKTTLEFFHNQNNLRTLCTECHKQVTGIYLRGRTKSR
jgi:5-methylcytosine-specific restriction endonuclease McrA